jgi:hypothetical protein
MRKELNPMPVSSRTTNPAPSPFLPNDVVTSAYERYREPLLAFVCNHLNSVDWRRGEELARKAWAAAVGSVDGPAAGIAEDEGLPGWLATTARRVIRVETSPSYLAITVLGADELLPTSSASARGLLPIESAPARSSVLPILAAVPVAA